MPWVMVSVMPHQPIVLTCTCVARQGRSNAGAEQAIGMTRRHVVATARADRPMSDSHVHPCWREMSQKRLVDHFGMTTKRAPTHRLASIE